VTLVLFVLLLARVAWWAKEKIKKAKTAARPVVVAKV